MSDDDTPRGRRSRRDSEAPGGRPSKKKGGKGGKSKSKRDRTPECNQPFTSPDEFSNVSIKVQGDKRFYSNDCVLSWNSPVLSEKLNPENTGGGGGGGGGKGDKKGGGKKGGDKGGGGEKELDWSEYKLGDVIKLLEYMDPRVVCTVTDEDAYRIAPLAKAFEMETLLKSCEKQLTQSFFEKRRLRRLNMDVILLNLEIADANKFNDLTRMCIDTCVVNSNPYVNKKITESKEISEKTKVEILTRKLERANRRRAQEGSMTSRAGESGRVSHRDTPQHTHRD